MCVRCSVGDIGVCCLTKGRLGLMDNNYLITRLETKDAEKQVANMLTTGSFVFKQARTSSSFSRNKAKNKKLKKVAAEKTRKRTYNTWL